MKYVGPHVSAAGGVRNAPLNAQKVGARAFGMFTKSPRRWAADQLDADEIKAFKSNLRKCGFTPARVLVHSGYLLNLADPEPAQWRDTREAFTDEVRRCGQLGLKTINTHPGRFGPKLDETKSLELVADSVNYALDKIPGVTILLENMSGGSWIGSRFEHLAAVIEQIENKKRTGVCFDTCHAFGAGYDVRTADALDATLKEFRRVVGMKHLKAAHLNDAKIEFAGQTDRHQTIGKGNIGKECFRAIMNDKRFENKPLILETPDPTQWPGEIKMLYRWAE